MRDTKLHNRNLFSIAGIENNFSDKAKLSELLFDMLRGSQAVIVYAKRPFYEIRLSVDSIANVKLGVSDLKISDDLFELFLVYKIGESDGDFVKTALAIWFEFEQPSFCFLKEEENLSLFTNRKDFGLLSWKQLILIGSCLVVFRGAEEDVLWVGKSDEIDFRI